MITELSPYPSYKDSGVPWLGEVPEHWDLQQLGRIGRFAKGSGGSKEDEVEQGVPCIRYGDIYTQHQYFIHKSKACISSERAVDYTPIKCGDLLFAASGETIEEIGKSTVSLIEEQAYCGGDVIIFRPSVNLNAAFLGLASDCWQSAFQKSTMGRGITVMHIYVDELKYMWIPIPPHEEQTAIVRYLDYMDRRILRYIRAKQKLIELLEEQKQAIIHRAVTGQIDVRTGQPYPAYKPSGVEWLGDIPEHWEVVPLKRIAKFKSGAGFPVSEQGGQEFEIPFLKVSDMNRPGNEKWIKTADSRVSIETAERLGAFVFPAGTIIFPKVGGALLTNKRRFLREPSCIDNNVMGCVVDGADLEYAFLLLTQLDLGRLAKPGPVPAIGEGDIREIKATIPSSSEQGGIVSYVEATTGKINSSLSNAFREISLLKEYRTRLIADVVTGKLDVREAAANLPEEADNEELSEDISKLVEGKETIEDLESEPAEEVEV